MRLIGQIYACQASSEKHPRKNINTDGNEIADLQETMQSVSSAVSPHLSWQQGLGGCALAKPAGALGRCDLALGAVGTKSWPYKPATPRMGSQKICKNKTHEGTHQYLTRSKLYFYSGETLEGKSLPIIAMKTFIWPWSMLLTRFNYFK